MRWVRRAFVLYVVAVLFVTMTPSRADAPEPWWADAVLGALARVGIHTGWVPVEAIANGLMFVPFGVLGVVLLAHARPRWGRGVVWLAVAVTGFAFSGLIETVQLAIPGRVTDLQDVALNGLGSVLGGVVGVVVLALLARGGRTSSDQMQ